MNERQKDLLELLDGLIDECEECPLHHNGKALPYWSPISRYLIIGDFPDYDEVEADLNEKFWNVLKRYDFKKEEFGIINRVQCRPTGKPQYEQMEACKKWIRKFVKCLDPSAGLLMGKFGSSIINLNFKGLSKDVLMPRTYTEDKTFHCICTVGRNENVEKFEPAVQKFRGILCS